jgi:L-aspartate oxidase
LPRSPGGHSQRRIIHAADATGHAVQLTLEEQVRKHPNITLLEHHFAIDLVTTDKLGLTDAPPRCLGLYVQDVSTGEVMTIAADHTVLATGGAGKVYLYTTNPDTATGDGLAMAWRAGCRPVRVCGSHCIALRAGLHGEVNLLMPTEILRGAQ